MLKHHTHYSVESVVDRGAAAPSPSWLRGLGRRAVEVEQQTCLPRAIEDQGPLSQWTEDMLQRNFHCPTYNINIHTGLFGTRIVLRNIVSSSLHYAPWSSSSPPPPPQRRKSTTSPKTSPHQSSHHQCAAAGIDPIGSPHPRIQCSGPLQKDPHPEPASGRALTPSRTRFSSPLAIGGNRTGSFRQPSQKERNRDVCPRNGPGLPFTGPSPGPNPPTYPSSLPRAVAKLPENIPSRGH